MAAEWPKLETQLKFDDSPSREIGISSSVHWKACSASGNISIDDAIHATALFPNPRNSSNRLDHIPVAVSSSQVITAWQRIRPVGDGYIWWG
jgi:hypothetical protein